MDTQAALETTEGYDSDTLERLKQQIQEATESVNALKQDIAQLEATYSSSLQKIESHSDLVDLSEVTTAINQGIEENLSLEKIQPSIKNGGEQIDEAISKKTEELLEKFTSPIQPSAQKETAKVTPEVLEKQNQQISKTKAQLAAAQAARLGNFEAFKQQKAFEKAALEAKHAVNSAVNNLIFEQPYIESTNRSKQAERMEQ